MIFKTMALLITIGGVVFGQSITDVSKTKPEYSAIQNSVDNGYFTLVNDNQFLPNQPVTRAELAMILDRLDALASKAELSKSDIIELKDFSTSFKKYLLNDQQSSTKVSTDIDFVKTEQKTLNYDISRVEERLQGEETKNKDQDLLIWLGLGFGLFGVLR